MQLIIGIYKTGGRYERAARHSSACQRAMARSSHPNRKHKIKTKGENMSRLKNRRGQGLVEYVLVLVLMAVLSVGAVHYLGKKTHNAFAQAGTALNNEMTYTTSNGSTSGQI